MQEKVKAKTPEFLLKNSTENISANIVQTNQSLSRLHSLKIYGKREQIWAIAETLNSARALRWERTECGLPFCHTGHSHGTFRIDECHKCNLKCHICLRNQNSLGWYLKKIYSKYRGFSIFVTGDITEIETILLNSQSIYLFSLRKNT